MRAGEDAAVTGVPLRLVLVLAATLAVAACAQPAEKELRRAGPGKESRPPESPSRSEPSLVGEKDVAPLLVPGAAKLRPLAGRLARRCADLAPVADLCPPVVPATEGPYLATRFEDRGFASFDLSSGGVREGKPALNRPPAFAHILVEAGDLGRAHPELEAPSTPAGKAAALTDALLESRRREPVSLGTVTLAKVRGRLILMPPYPFGGPHGDHLVFVTGSGAATEVVSLHSWIPAKEALATLESLVGSHR